MKRTLCIILILLFALCLFSCEKKEPSDPPASSVTTEDPGEATALTVIFYGSGEDTAGKDLSAWDPGLVSSHKDENAPETFEIDVLGKKFDGEYVYSAVFYPATHLTHCYKGKYASFTVNAETGKLDSFIASYQKTEETVSAEECEERAREAAKVFINIEDYKLEVIEADPENNRTEHTFTWTKYVDDMPTNDKFSISLSIYGGGIASIGCSLVGSFELTDENVRAVRRLSKADANAALSEKIEERYSGIEHDVFVGEYSAITLPDGTVALTTRAEITRNETDEADGETYFYPHTSAYDAFIFESGSN